MVPPDTGPGHTVPPLGYARLLAFHICLYSFGHVKQRFVMVNAAHVDLQSVSGHDREACRGQHRLGDVISKRTGD